MARANARPRNSRKNVPKRIRIATEAEFNQLMELKLQWDVPTFPTWRYRREMELLSICLSCHPDTEEYKLASEESIELIKTYPKGYNMPQILMPTNWDDVDQVDQRSLIKFQMALAEERKQIN